ncbi:serine/threonine-protein kinase HipA [Rhodobacter aestuarii]|uniref:Serine/threonine-protein kinase HipA n=1 Tax=Rhodobacter aestuarii TaxID=453582 RepID=A0A1N7PZ99_9RHOB|nr:HipA domain-containing protein [Rhodobacter aestuarii]PTV93967.1 serine/threonine-protein kinase HipA [Rhodobacter aestuarii]SIT15906.1 serine/threonine-protein kinase HipA [Rhodobacter aestuarii]
MKLDVWLEAFAAPVGTLSRHDDKSLTFTYAPGSQPTQRISMSLPLRDEPYRDADARAFFGNLLFEGRELDRVMAVHGLDRDDIGGLLEHLGADCPGALSVTPEGTGPGKRPGVFPDDYEEIEPARLLSILRSLHFYGRLPDDTRDPSPIAGVQPKLALVARDGRYYVPRAGSRAPSTHILKVSPRTQSETTRHEAALLTLARTVGLDVAEPVPLTFEDDETGAEINAILSTRFDRSFEGAKITRTHCEDFCQALGLPKELKYERNAVQEDRKFSLRAISTIAERSAAPGLFRMTFLQQMLFNLMVGNTDNHGKNGTILYKGTSGTLAPLYDVVPVILDRTVTHRLSFTLGGAEWSEDVTMERLMDAMRDLGFARPRLDRPTRLMLERLASEGPGQLGQVGPLGDKALADAVAAQMTVVEEGLGLGLPIAPRDYYPRLVRDEKPEGGTGGWGGLS